MSTPAKFAVDKGLVVIFDISSAIYRCTAIYETKLSEKVNPKKFMQDMLEDQLMRFDRFTLPFMASATAKNRFVYCKDVEHARERRMKIFSEYKQRRKPLNDLRTVFFENAKNWMEETARGSVFENRISVVPPAGYNGPLGEADDFIATVARHCQDALHQPCIIVSTDSDMYPLLNPEKGVFIMDDRSRRLVTCEKVQQKFGVAPSQMADLKAIAGDATDNIPGVDGIGRAGAAKLLQKFSTLDNVYANLDKIADRQRKLLVAGRDSAYMSKKLLELVSIPEIIPMCHL